MDKEIHFQMQDYFACIAVSIALAFILKKKWNTDPKAGIIRNLADIVSGFSKVPEIKAQNFDFT